MAAAGSPAQAQGARARTPATRPADLILKNANVITIDARSSIAQAIAIAGDKILAVGPDAAMAAHTAPATRVLDLKKRTVTPGLIDGHAHMDREALRNVFPALGKVRSIKDIQDRIAELARGKKPGEWIVTMPIGDPPYYFDVPDILAEKRWPTRQELDAAAPNNPVYIRSIWGYWRGTFPLVSCANTEALKRAGITRDTVSPVPSLTIEKDGNGDPTGVFIEQEIAPIAELIWFRDAARFSHADRLRALPESAKAYHGVGTTSIFEGHGVANELLRVYKQAHRDGTLTMRSTLAFSANWPAAGDAPLGPFVEAWAGWLGEPGLGDDWLKMGGLYVQVGRGPADDVRAAAGPYTGWAGFNSSHGLPPRPVQGTAAAMRQKRHPRGLHRRRRRARHARFLRGGRQADSAQRPALGGEPRQRHLAARHRADRAHGARADDAHQRLSLQGAGDDRAQAASRSNTTTSCR